MATPSRELLDLLNRCQFVFYDDWAFAMSGAEFLTPDRQTQMATWHSDPETLPEHRVRAKLELTAEEWLVLYHLATLAEEALAHE